MIRTAQQPTHIASVLTPDRVGIIHEIVSLLGRLQVVTLEISQTVVHGAFTIVLVLELPPEASPDSIQQDLNSALGSAATVALAPYVERQSPVRQAESYILTAIGPAGQGVVRALTGLIMQRGGSFSDFSSQVVDDRLQLLAEVDLPADVALAQLQIDLQHACDDKSLTVRLQHHRLFVATNEIAFRHNL